MPAGCLRTLTPRFQGNLNFELVKYVVCERLCTWLNTLLAYVLLLACANMPATKCFAAGLRWKCFSNVSFTLIHSLFPPKQRNEARYFYKLCIVTMAYLSRLLCGLWWMEVTITIFFFAVFF